MNRAFSIDELADTVNRWCQKHRVFPANGQAGERMTVRNIRYYRTLGLIDPPELGAGRGFGDKHRLQLLAIRLLQARGLPLSRIQELLYARSIEELQRIETDGLAELEQDIGFRPTRDESWKVIPLNDEFLLIGRHGRGIPAELRERLRELLPQTANLREMHEQ